MDPAYAAANNGGALVGTAAVLLVLTWISVGLRTYVRAWMTNGFKADDVLMLVSQSIFTVSCAFILRGVAVGIGRHDTALPQANEIDALMWQALATATYVIDMMFIKLSLGIFLLRFSVQKRYKYILWTTLVVVAIWSSVLFIWDIFQCNPVQAQWDYTILDRDPKAHCVTSDQVVAAAYSLSVMSIITDWLFALLPIFMVWNVKMTRQAKLTVSIILGLGVFASIATLIRLKFLADLNDVNDILFAGTDAMVWTLIEPGVAIIASSLVTIRPLLQRMKLKGFESTPRGSSNTGGRSASNRGPGRSGGTPGELTLIDLETGGDKYHEPGPPPPVKDNPRVSARGLPSQNFPSSTTVGHNGPYSDSDESHLRSPAQSETYVIEGDRVSDRWTSFRNESVASDTDEIANLEAHSQDVGRPDLGRGGR